MAGEPLQHEVGAVTLPLEGSCATPCTYGQSSGRRLHLGESFTTTGASHDRASLTRSLPVEGWAGCETTGSPPV
eukprot:9903795-Heterocapsa_arctica.AAC.1